jgi:hypothetical protein
VFTTPHTVLSGTSPQWIDVGQDAARTVALVGGGARPAGLIVEAESGIATDRWVLAQLRLGSPSKPAVFWGHAADPSTLTSGGQDCVANLLHLLYQAR